MKKFSFWVCLFLIYNLIFIVRLPIFNDEAIYIHWGQIIIDNPYRWWFSLRLDGKQPLFFIILGLVANFSPLDILFSSRFVSLFFGTLTFWSTVKIFPLLYPKKKKDSLYFLLTTCCYLLFFNRLAIMEAAITGLWYLALYLFLLLIEKPSWKKGFFLGLILALGWWIKSSMLLILPLFCFNFIVVYYFLPKSGRSKFKFWPFFLSGLVFLGFISPLFFSSHFNQISLEQRKWILSFQEVLSFPFALWWNNFYKGTVWLITYLTPLPFLLFIWQLLLGFKRPSKSHYFILAWVLSPFFTQVLISKSYTSRYLLMVVPAMLIFSSLGWQRIKNSLLERILALGTLVPALIFILSPITFFNLLPRLKPLQSDKRQYINHWSSGYGINETIKFLRKKAHSSPLVVFVRQDYGNPEDAVFCLLKKEKDIRVIYLSSRFIIERVEKLQQLGITSYFVSRGKKYAGLEEYLQEVIKFPKPQGDEFVGVYKFINP